MATRTLTIHDGGPESTPDLRPAGRWRRRLKTLPLWISVLTFLLGTGGGTMIGIVRLFGPVALRSTGIALAVDVKADLAAAEAKRMASEKVEAERAAAMFLRLDKIDANQALILQSLPRRRHPTTGEASGK